MEKASIPEYEALEQKLIAKNAQFREYFTSTGVIGDMSIKDPRSGRRSRKRKSGCTRTLRSSWRTTRRSYGLFRIFLKRLQKS